MSRNLDELIRVRPLTTDPEKLLARLNIAAERTQSIIRLAAAGAFPGRPAIGLFRRILSGLGGLK
jgi:hypothetical protein